MQDHPLVSIITPTYNRADFLKQTIESVLAQSYKNIEHVIIDDGSTDNTKALIEKYLDTGKVRYFYQDNSGQSVARNKGLKEAEGDFVCFLDSDDYFLPKKVEQQIQAFQNNPTVDLAYGDYIFVDANGSTLNEENMTRYSGNITRELLKDNCVSMNTTMVRKSAIKAIGGFCEHIKVADDYDLWLRLSAQSNFLYIPSALSAYRLMDNQISSNKKARFESNEEIITRFIKEHPSLLSQQEQIETFNRLYVRAARHFSGQKELQLSSHYLIKAFQEDFFAKRNWRALLRFVLNLLR